MQPADLPRVWRILHVEDSELDHELMQALLRKAGWQVQWQRVESLEQFDAALQQDWDAVVCDYQLPQHSGLDFLQRLRESSRVLPLILVSGEIGEDVAVEAMRAGAADYLLKGRLARLVPALSQAIKGAEAERARQAADLALRDSQRQLRELAAHLQTRIEAERAAWARELHDDVGSALTALKYELGWMQRHAQQPALVERAQHASQTLDDAIAASRRLMQNLRPPILQEGLVAALQWLLHGVAGEHGLCLSLAGAEREMELPEETALVAYRFVQEALSNVIKHAQARTVEVELQLGSGVLGIEVRDDGRGLDPGAPNQTGRFGLRGLQERAAAVGGWLDLASRPGQGTQLMLHLPLSGNWSGSAGSDAGWLEASR